MDKISRLTGKVMVIKNLDKAAQAAFVCYEAGKVLEDLFPKEFLKEIIVLSYKDGNLYLITTSPTYAQEIILKQSQVLDQVNTKVGKSIVKRIRFKK